MKNSSLTIFIFQLWIVQLRQKLLIIIQERGIQEIVRESRGNLFWNVSWIYYENKYGIRIFCKRNTIVSKRLYPRIYVSFSPTTILRIIESNRIVTIPKEKSNFIITSSTRIPKQQKRLIIEMSLSIERPHIIAAAWIRLVAVHRRRSKTHRLRCFTREQGNNSGDYWLGSNIISPIGTRGGQSGRETRFPVSRWFVDDAINSI